MPASTGWNIFNLTRADALAGASVIMVVMPATPKLSYYVLLLIIAWMAVMTWRIYPQFKDAVRVDGRLTTVDAYIDDACGERVGPAAETCLAEARGTAQRLLRREQGKSVLLIEAPLLGYLLVYLPLALWRERRDNANAGVMP